LTIHKAISKPIWKSRDGVFSLVRQAEIELAKRWARLRKEKTGRGPIDTQVRIAGDVLFIKFKVEYTFMEKQLIKKLIEFHNGVTDFDTSPFGYTKEDIDQMLDECIRGLATKAVRFRIEPDFNYAFLLVILNLDLEKALRFGKIASNSNWLGLQA
jgi:uncharacterized protein YbcI